MVTKRSARRVRTENELGEIGDWRLIRAIRNGRKTTTYYACPRACGAGHSPDYVLKLLKASSANDPFALSQLRREAHVGRNVSHPHVVPVLAANLRRPPYFIVMPRLEGATLADVLELNGSLVVCRALWIARQIADGLSTLHQLGWIHGDIKPANIFVSGQCHATLIDLGFARRPDSPGAGGSVEWRATIDYAAPESFVDSRPIDHRSDIYSLGVTLYEMLTGERPFRDKDPARIARAHLRQPPRNPRQIVPNLPSSVSRLLQQMLAKEPLRRPQDADELIRKLVKLEIETFGYQVTGKWLVQHNE